jgi:hypothetical protein
MKMENNCIVYRHIRLDKNEPFYIGIAENPNRPYQKYKRNNYWKNIINMTEYRVDILFDDLTWEEACEKEKEFIQLYGRKNLGTGTLVNMTDGGEGSLNRRHTEESKLKISKAHSGENNHFYGKKFTQEHKDKISKSLKENGNAGGDRGKYLRKSGKGIRTPYPNKYTAGINVECKWIHLGTFNTKEEALTARLEAEKKYWNTNA